MKDEEGQVKRDPRRGLPAVDRLGRELARRFPELPAWARNEGARRAVGAAREAVARGATAPDLGRLVEDAARRAADLARPHPRRVVNATGVVLHTNLGRARLAPDAARAVAEVAAFCSDVELDLRSGRRGDRLEAVTTALRLLSGAEAALAVNNNAGAILLTLDTLARGREVIVSRGELVEIGGSFRIPEIMEKAGVRLVEVGTTNRTHPEDYRRAVGPETALLLKVHRSNFRQTGFVREVTLPELRSVADGFGLPVVEDLGSGTLVDLRPQGLPEESFAPARLRLGAHVVCFSGDKLLGGPQAGLILGDATRVAPMRRNPLARALRLDKLSLAALDWTLRALLEAREREIPTVRQLLLGPEEIGGRAEALVSQIARLAPPGVEVRVVPGRSAVGGGSLPDLELETRLLRLAGMPPEGLAARLRTGEPPVLCRVQDDALVLDLRTVSPDEEDLVLQALRAAFSGAPPRSDSAPAGRVEGGGAVG